MFILLKVDIMEAVFLSIYVDSDLSLEEAHHICDKVEHMHAKGISSVYAS